MQRVKNAMFYYAKYVILQIHLDINCGWYRESIVNLREGLSTSFVAKFPSRLLMSDSTMVKEEGILWPISLFLVEYQ